MKRLLTIIAFIALSTLTLYSQQMYVGAGLGTSKIGGECTVSVVPEFGYYIDNNNSLSLLLGYATYAENDIVNHSVMLMPRYSCIIPFDDKWRLDVNMSAGYARFFKSYYNRVGLYLGPQLEYHIKPQWTIWCGFDAISMEIEWHDKNGNITNSNFNWFNTGINFGFYYYIKN